MIVHHWLKKVMSVVVLSMALLFFVVGQPTTQASTASERVLVGFNGPVNAALIENAGGDVDHVFEHISVIEARLPAQAQQALLNHANIAYIETNEVVKATDIIPWGIERIFDTEQRLNDTWSSAQGEGVSVAVLDTGIDGAHSDLNVVGGVNFVNSDPFDVDQNTHGTHVAGIIAALNNGSGIAGVAPQVSLYSVTVLDAEGSGFMSDVIQGIEWAMNQNIDIINMSLGAESASSALESAAQAAYDAGHLLIAAAGNEGVQNGQGDTVSYPAKLPTVIAVAAATENDQRANFSSHGAAVELMAPGVNILSTMPNQNYASKNGTSMAAPHVAGVAALMWSVNPNLTNVELREILQETAEDLGLSTNHQGHGMVDGFNAFNTAHQAFETIEYTITVNPLEHGEISPSGTFDVPAGATVSFEIFPDDGYQIDEIRINDDVVSNADVITIENIQENMVFDVRLAPKAYTLSFETFGGSSVETQTILFGTDLSEPEAPSKEGHTFMGWFIDDTLDTPFTFDTMPAYDLTLYAGWDVNAYDLMFFDADESLFETITVDYGTDLTTLLLPEGPDKEGHTFTGYDQALPEAMPAESLSFYAEYDLNAYTITLFDEDGQFIDTLSVFYDEPLDLPTLPDQNGMMFDVWLDENLVPFEDAFMPAKDLELTAAYTEKTYQLIFLDDAGDVFETFSFTYRASLETVSLPEGPEKEGHTFVDWDGTLPSVMPDEDVVFQATYSTNAYEVYYQTAEELANHRVYYAFGEPVTWLDPPERQGYTFTGWVYDGEPVMFETMPAKNIVLVATYEPLPINLQGVNDGQIYQYNDTIVVDFTGEATLNDEPVEPGTLSLSPGDYELEITNGDNTESVTFTVQSHPYQSIDVIMLALMGPLFMLIGLGYVVKFVLWTVGMI